MKAKNFNVSNYNLLCWVSSAYDRGMRMCRELKEQIRGNIDDSKYYEARYILNLRNMTIFLNLFLLLCLTLHFTISSFLFFCYLNYEWIECDVLFLFLNLFVMYRISRKPLYHHIRKQTQIDSIYFLFFILFGPKHLRR